MLLLVGAGLSALCSGPVLPRDLAVTSMAGTLATNPEIHNSNKSRYIKLTLREYPLRSFSLQDDAYYASASGAMAYDLHADDSVWMQVATTDYNENVAPQSVPERMLPVAVYALRKRGEDFLTLEGYCKEANSAINTWAGVICLAMAALIILAAYLQARKKSGRAKMPGDRS